MIGPGKYDDLCTKIRLDQEASGVLLVVIHGLKGTGFSVQLPPVLMQRMPVMLRDLAAQIEADMELAK